MNTTIFKTLTLGESKKSLEKKLKAYEVGFYARELFENMQISDKQDVDLVILTPADLGFTEAPTTTELFKKAVEQGYELCPPDVGPVLRVNYDDQPTGEWLFIAMESITDSDGGPRVFRVRRDRGGGRWLGSDWADPDARWYLGRRFVFRIKQEKTERIQEPVLDRIFEKVEKTDTCWNWTGAIRKGYGRIQKGKRGEGLLSVHRVVYEMLVGNIPPKMVLDHLCRNRACVNPDHMEIVTNAENVRRGIEYKENLRKDSALSSDTKPSAPLSLSPSAPKPRKESKRQALTRIADALEVIATKLK